MRSHRVGEHNKKYQAGISDKRVEEMAAKIGRDPYEVAQSFGAPGPRKVKTYTSKQLLDAYIDFVEQREHHKDLREFYTNYWVAMAKCFGVALDERHELDEPEGVSWEVGTLLRLVHYGADAMDKIYSPFSCFLEAPKTIHEMFEKHQSGIGGAMVEFKARMRDMMEDCFFQVYPGLREKTISSDDLMAVGFDDHETIKPDPDDYW